MGVLNVTPDSFSDGGKYLTPEAAVCKALEMEAQGAEIIDVGGESTRPGSASVGEEEEMRRVVPAIRAIRERTPVPISIDTTKASVARAALEAGADVVNDITALRADPAMLEVALRHRAGVVLMHMQGTPRTMQAAPSYGDAVHDVGKFLRQRIDWVIECGMPEEVIAIDPGIGFGKTPDHNRALLNATDVFAATGRPVLVGVSNKSFLRHAGKAPEFADRHWPGVAITCLCRELGARIFRVHEPAPHVQALRMTEAILGHPTGDV